MFSLCLYNHSSLFMLKMPQITFRLISLRFSIPSTISKKSQEILKSLRSREPTFVAPGPDDAKGWQKLNQQIIPLLQMTQPAVDSYHPNITVTELGDVNVLDIKPRDWRDNGKVLVYLHGGGYTLLSANSTLGTAPTHGQFYRT